MANHALRAAAQLCASSYYKDVMPTWARNAWYLQHGTDDVYLIDGEKASWVIFRGTEWSLPEWWRNFQIKKIEGEGMGRVHAGFFTNLMPLWKELNHHDSFKRERIYFTGHSRGGALAQLAALQHKNIYNSAPKVFTFGSPRVGDRSFVEAYGDIETIRLTHAFDIVPQVPRIGFWHAGQQITRFKRGHKMWRYLDSAYDL